MKEPFRREGTVSPWARVVVIDEAYRLSEEEMRQAREIGRARRHRASRLARLEPENPDPAPRHEFPAMTDDDFA